MTTGLADMHERYIPAESPEAEAAKDFKEFCRGLTWEMYKNMIVASPHGSLESRV